MKNIIIIIISCLAIVGFVNASETYTKATRDRTVTIASSTLASMGGITGTSTIYLGNPSFATYISKLYCITDTGTTTVVLKHTASTTSTTVCGPSGAEGTLTNNTLTARETLKIDVGTISTTTNQVSVTITSRDN